MRLRRFDEVSGQYITKICGQDRFAFAQSDSADFYDLIEWAKRGAYPGSVLSFYDFATGAVYRPFEKRENALYSDPVYLLSERDEVRCYFPTPFRFAPGEHESVQFVRDGKVYLENWVEEGWDDAQDRATEDYRMYYETVVRDFSGRELSREVGGLYQSADGDWWMA